MHFWDWINEETRVPMSIKAVIIVIVFVVIPTLIYLMIIWDPVIGHNEDGDTIQLGMYVIIGIYWVAAYFSYKNHELKSELKYLMRKEDNIKSDNKLSVKKSKKMISKSYYRELEKKIKNQGEEIEEYKVFYNEVSPLLEKLNNNPELVKAILEGKIDLKSVSPSAE